jgi:hypothetical protein
MHCIESRSAGRRPLRSAAATLASVAWLLLPPLAVAQTQPPGQMQTGPQGQTPASSISDQQLTAAAAAIRQVTMVRQTYAQKIAAAPPSAKKQMTTEANSALVKAVTDQGLSVDQYNTILQMARNDPTLRQKLIQRIGPSKQ